MFYRARRDTPGVALDSSASQNITLLLARLGDGDKSAESMLVPALYDQLHRLASLRLKGEQKAISLRPTELVNEAYLKLLAHSQANYENRAHFFATAARVMRNILIDYIRSRAAEKRGGAMARIEFDERLAQSVETPDEILALHEALERLEAIDPDQARIVELRYFAGFTTDEVAGIIGKSVRSVEREWEYARKWLYSQLSRRASHGS